MADFQKVGITQIFAMKKGDDTLGGEYIVAATRSNLFASKFPELPRVPIFKRRGLAGRLSR